MFESADSCNIFWANVVLSVIGALPRAKNRAKHRANIVLLVLSLCKNRALDRAYMGGVGWGGVG